MMYQRDIRGEDIVIVVCEEYRWFWLDRAVDVEDEADGGKVGDDGRERWVLLVQ